MNGFYGRGAQDAFYDFLALQLAREPIEVMRGFGYRWLCQNIDGLMSGSFSFAYAGGVTREIPLKTGEGTLPRVFYPVEAQSFERCITLSWQKKPGKPGEFGAILVEVTVRPKEKSRMRAFFSREGITLRGLITGHD